MQINAENHIYVAGRTIGTFDPTQTNAGGQDLLLARFAAEDGKRQWSQVVGTVKNEQPWAMAIDAFDDLYLVGGTSGNLAEQANAGKRDAFFVKFK